MYKMHSNIEAFVLISAILIGIAAPVVPVLTYVAVGWSVKRNDIMDGLTNDAREHYVKMFSLNSYTRTGDRSYDFERFYTHWYGRRYFILPITLLVSVLTLATIAVVLTALHRFPQIALHEQGRYDLPATAIAAIAGAYLWVTSDFIFRARRLDFSPTDVLWGVLRLVISVPMGYAFSAFAKDDLAAPIAFSLGAFPLAPLIDFLQHIMYSNLKLAPAPESSNDLVTELQGVEEKIAKRLADEDITTVTQIAYCDPVRLVMRSNLSFNFVIDCMNQALAWLYFEKQMATLRPLGLRGATEIADLIDNVDNEDQETRKKAEDTLQDVTNALKPPHTTNTMRATFDQIAEDPYTVFLRKVWTNPFEDSLDKQTRASAFHEDAAR